jgi:hypothetical protein
MKGKTWLLIVLLVFFVPAVQAELTLKPIHPDEAVEHTLKQRFSHENALANMEAIKSFLESFRRLSAAARGKIPAQKLKSIGNTDWEIQELAFRNLPRDIQGALRYQDLLLKKTLYQLAICEAKAGKTPAQKAAQTRQEMEQAEKEFQIFWNGLAIAD